MFLARGGGPPARGRREIQNFQGNFDDPSICWLHRSPRCSTGCGLCSLKSQVHHTSISAQLGTLRLLKSILKFNFHFANPCTDLQFRYISKISSKFVNITKFQSSRGSILWVTYHHCQYVKCSPRPQVSFPRNHVPPQAFCGR